MRGVALLLVLVLLLPVGWAQDASPVKPTLVWKGLANPVDIEFGPDGALYYIELKQGGLRRIAPNATSPDPEPLWTAPSLQTGGERGLMGMALAPDFATSGAIYVFYTYNGTGTPVDRLSRIVDGHETVLLDNIRTEIMHNSGRILFLPDGTMLVSVGDATLDTIGRQASMHAHDPADIHGKVLHLNADGTAAAGNPWGNMAWTKGHRNVYGLARNPDGSIVLATENGPERGDEVNLLVAGKDYGWPTCAGPCAQDPNCNGCDATGFVEPLFSYTPTVAPTGAAWYNGSFYFTDFNQGRLHRVHELPNGSWTDTIVTRLETRALDVAAGADGLYFTTWDSVYRVVPGDEALEPPAVSTPATTPPTATTPQESVSPPPGAQAIGGGSANRTPGLEAPLVLVAALAVGLAARRKR